MDRGAWQPAVRRVTRLEHDLVTKPPPVEFNASFDVKLDYTWKRDIKFLTHIGHVIKYKSQDLNVLHPDSIRKSYHSFHVSMFPSAWI